MKKVKNANTVQRGNPDYTLFFSVLTLLALGIVMVFSASMPRSLRFYDTAYYFIKRQGMWAVLGLISMFFFMNFDCWRYRKVIPLVYGVSLVLLTVVLVPGIGQLREGSRRWLGVGNLGFQPAELAKTTTVLFLADQLGRKRGGVRLAKDLAPYLLLIGATAGLILMEPDLGTATILAANSVLVLFIAGANVWYLVGLAAVATPIVYKVITAEEYMRARLLAFRNPWKDPLGSGYQVIQSLYAFGSGGLFGQGIGLSRQKGFYLPQADTDFVFSVIGEELGFFGTSLVVGLFVIIAWRGYTIAMNAPDRFSCLLAAGLTSGVVIQAAVNMGVSTGVLPITGITLPFISYGGSSLLMSLSSVGILLNVSRYTVDRS